MKKLMIVAAVVTAGVAMADIESANIVGYGSKNVTKDFYIGNTSFQDVGGDGLVDVASFLTTTANPATYDTTGQAPTLQFLKADGVSYNKFTYISDAYDENDNEMIGWADVEGYVATDKYPCGTAFWYQSNGQEADITINGEVSSAATVTKDVRVGYTLIGNPFPTGMDLSTLTTTLAPATYDTTGDAPTLQFLKADGVSYTKYTYISDAYDADDNEVTGWADVEGYVVDGLVGTGLEGFWVQNNGASATAGTVTFVNPIAR